jgi:hypothetical protein
VVVNIWYSSQFTNFLFVVLVGWDQVRPTLFTSLVKMLLQAKENWVWRIIYYIPFAMYIPLWFYHKTFMFWQYHDSTATLQMV